MVKLRDSGNGYDYLAGAARYSSAVVARPGYALHRVRLARPVIHDLAFELIMEHLQALGLPGAALAAVELRSPEQFTEGGFADYNVRYQHALLQLGIDLDRSNPVARSNLCPIVDPPPDVAVHAFSYATPVTEIGPGGLAPLDRTFVISGSAEVPDNKSNYSDHIIARGDISPEGLSRKVRWVVAEMGRRLDAVGADWDGVTGTQVYSVRDVGGLVASDVQAAIARAVTWHACMPPIVELEFEMDCRRIATELVLEPAVS